MSTDNKFTYEEIVNMRNSGKLEPNKCYHIVDYVTTTVQPNTRSVGHQFDIVVMALDESSLCEEARIVHHDKNGYLRDRKLNACKIWYSLDNDIDRFAWADIENGKGVIYRMIDEYNNDCPYDFLNIQFKYSKEWMENHQDWCTYVLGYVPEDDMYFYTFSFINDDGTVDDLSLVGNKMTNENGGINGVHDNYIESCDWMESKSIYKLGANVFIASRYWADKCFCGLYGNKLRANCECNVFGNECHYNVLKGGCKNNVFGNYCEANKLFQNCCYNTFKSSSHSNQLGCGCSNIELNDSSHNSFGAECSNIVTGYNFHYNTFGSYCRNIIIGDENDLLGNVKFNIFENNVRNIYFKSIAKSHQSPVQNVTVCQGIKGDKNKYKDVIIDVVGQNYQLKVANDTRGGLNVYCPAN